MSVEWELKSPYSLLPRESQNFADYLRDQFQAAVLDICGDTRLFYLPRSSETTTSTDRSRNARVFTYDATAASRYSQVGSGVSVDFDGTDDEADVPDADNLGFGDAVVDQPFSVVVLCKPDVNNAAITLLAKEASATAEEWNLRLNASGHLVMTLTDESATATIVGTFATAVGTSRTLLGATYDGAAASVGIKAYQDGARKTTAASASGTYVAMENTAALVHLGARYATKEEFFNGGIEMALLVAKELSQDEHWRLKDLVNAYFDLAL